MDTDAMPGGPPELSPREGTAQSALLGTEDQRRQNVTETHGVVETEETGEVPRLSGRQALQEEQQAVSPGDCLASGRWKPRPRGGWEWWAGRESGQQGKTPLAIWGAVCSPKRAR